MGRRRTMLAPWGATLRLGLLLSIGSCGYTHGVRLPLEAQTVGVSVFANSSQFPSVEREIFACLSEQTAHMVQGRILPPNRAQVVVEGNILDYRRLLGVQNTEAELLSSGVQIHLQAWLVDRRTAQTIGEVLEFDQAVRYVLDGRQGEAGARRSALQHLCQEIVLDLFNQEHYLQAPQAAADGLDRVQGLPVELPAAEDPVIQGSTPE